MQEQVAALPAAALQHSNTAAPGDSYLKRIDFHDDQWARVIHLPKYGSTDVVVDQQRSFGAPIFATGGVRLETVLAAFKRGAGIDELTNEYGVPEADLLNVLRVHTEAA
ncbi:MAG: DUF433 domain-containing protein [Pseudonocardiaceae bacterium]